MQAIKLRAQAAAALDDQRLRDRVVALQQRMVGSRQILSIEFITESFALTCAAVRRRPGYRFDDGNILAAIVLATGSAVEMNSYQSSSLGSILPAALYAIGGRKVHVISASACHADRNCEAIQPALEMMGLTAGVAHGGAGLDRAQTPYGCDVVFGSVYQFGLDALEIESAETAHSCSADQSTAFAIVDDIISLSAVDDTFLARTRRSQESQIGKSGSKRAGVSARDFLRRYGRISGIAKRKHPAAIEFARLLELPVVRVPMRQPIRRRDESNAISADPKTAASEIRIDRPRHVGYGPPALFGPQARQRIAGEFEVAEESSAESATFTYDELIRRFDPALNPRIRKRVKRRRLATRLNWTGKHGSQIH
jgi:preprotein translocase subunit SecA